MTSSFLACVLLTVTLSPTIFADLPDRPGTGFDDSFNGKQCDLSQGEVYLPGPSGKRADIAACKKSCEDQATCQSITFYKVSGWCSHFSSRCEKTRSAQGHAERVKDFTRFNQEECDWAQGEAYLPGPSGKRANIPACKKSCEDEPTCQSITFFREGWCSHFSSRCEKRKTVKNAHAERLKDFGTFNQKECDFAQGEVYLPGPSGKRANIPACKKSCEDEPTCKSITFFRDGLWCSHFSSRWEYNVEGKGMLPTVMEPQPISTAVGNNTSSMLTFKNPFKEPSTVQVHMETDDTKIFSLLLKRNKFSIGPLGILQVPYSFSPQTMTESKATIVVSMSKQLVWKYPLRGIAESASAAVDYHFKTRARKPHDETLRIVLPGFHDLSPADTFNHELNVQNPQHKGLVERSVFFEQKNDRLLSADDPLVFQMRFEPLRPFKTSTEFVIYKSTGGRWKFNVIFEALEPEVDDVIVIQSPLHKTSSVSFKLNNHLKSYAEYTAFFTSDSAPEFVVHPKSGLLEPYGKEGTNFIVSFTPTEYGKAKVGRMVIQTEEMQWTYEIRGSHPQYKIPEVGGGRIANRLSKDVVRQIKAKQQTKKNFLKENLKTQQVTRSPKKKTIDGLAGFPSQANISQRGGGGTATGARARDLSNERSVSKAT